MRRLVTVTLVVGSVLLAGCQSDADPDPKVSPTESSSVTPTPTPTGPVEPTLPAEAEGDDAAAAEAFVEHFWAMVNYAQASGDVTPLRQLSLPSCESCVAGADWIEDVYSRGGRIRGGEYTIDRIRVTALQADGLRLFEVKTSVSTTDQEVTGAGKLNEEFPADSGQIDLTLLVSSAGLQVSDWEAA